MTEATPENAVVRVLVSDVNAASMRAVNYANTLGVDDTRAINFAFSAEEGDAIRRDWLEQGRGSRSTSTRRRIAISASALSYLRGLTRDGRPR